MATDTKLGLVIGVAVVLTVGVIYYPKVNQSRDRANAVVPSLPAATRTAGLQVPAQTARR